MWKTYRCIASRYPRLSLEEERLLIKKAQNGSKESNDELILHHIGFLIFRIRRVLFPDTVRRYGEDILGEVILLAYEKINTYNLKYCDKDGNPHPVKFISYIWKRIDGFIIDSINKEFGLNKLYKEYALNEELSETDDKIYSYKRTRINQIKNRRLRSTSE